MDKDEMERLYHETMARMLMRVLKCCPLLANILTPCDKPAIIRRIDRTKWGDTICDVILCHEHWQKFQEWLETQPKLALEDPGLYLRLRDPHVSWEERKKQEEIG